MASQLHILVVDDDVQIRTMLRRYLMDEGFQVSDAEDGSLMRSVLESHKVDLVLLDLVMPNEDGFTLARDIRQRGNIPIIMLTGKGDLIDKVAGLEAGADDYIAKPFHLREVLARIRTVLRRTAGPTTASTPPLASSLNHQRLCFEGWKLNIAKRELNRDNGETIILTTSEFDLLRVFASNPNRVLERDTLMNLIKGREWLAYDRVIDAQVVRLRKKIEDNPGDPKLIKTIRGVGYIFAADVTTE